MSRARLSLSLGAALAVSMLAPSAGAIPRAEVLVRAKAFSFHPWTSTAANQTATCSAAYQSLQTPGDYMGLPYDWGGYMTLFDFDQQIAQGYGAGSYPEDGILACTSGLDCSGFVSKTWDAGHWTTSTVHQTSSTITQAQMLPGDLFNDAGNHMSLYSHTLQSGEPVLYESVFYNVHLSLPGWSWLQGYVPRRYNAITGASVGDPVGTSTNPIVVTSFPFSDQRDTTQSPSDVLDGCGASPTQKETGHEYIYAVTVTSPGTLTVSVQDDVGVDIDVHLYTSMSTNDCVARHDSTLSFPVDCGTYYVVADTFAGSVEYPGAYSLTIDHTAGGGSCGSGPPSYNFHGELGDDCAFPGNESLPYCNPNLGAITCIYTSSDSFCSKPCAVNSDCADLPTGGCCADIGGGELYCLTQDLCGGGGTGGGLGTDDPPDPQGDPEQPPPGEEPGVGGATTTGSGGAPAAASDDDDGASASSGCSTVPGTPAGNGWWLGLMGLWIAVRRRESAQ
jgi:hypothetical protein